MINISIQRDPIVYKQFSKEEWLALPKDMFHETIKMWCKKNNFMQHVGAGNPILARLPYRNKAGEQGIVECAQDFLDIVEHRRTYMPKT